MIQRLARLAFALACITCLVACAGKKSPDTTTVLESEPAGWTPPGEAAPSAPADPDPWPRTLESDTATIRVYSPQVESWTGNQLAFRCAVGVAPRDGGKEAFGVVWGSARTEVDREARRVTLEQTKLTRASFPTLPDQGQRILDSLHALLPTAAKTVALDRIESSLAASGATPARGLDVKSPVPRILVSYTPAILIPIAGKPVIKAVPGQGVERVLNTRAALLRVSGASAFFLHVYDGWLTAGSLDGPWTQVEAPPAVIPEVADLLAKQGEVDLLDGRGAQPPPSLAAGVPAIHTSQVAAELIVFQGKPELTPIGDTGLLFATNTTSDVLIEDASDQYYALISGRWYRAGALTGPWAFVPGAKLPASFARIPPTSAAGRVLAAVPGTPQAREAAIANSVPHTATIELAKPPKFEPSYDGAPQLRPIAGTSLQYVANSAVPVIRVGATSWYALQAGVWFTASSANGPWRVATSVPAALYAIPTSSPLHYVTYVQIYDSTTEYVYTGYTPGYLGTVVTTDGVVVYGTGYEYEPWVGTTYYAAPATYGVAAVPVYNPAAGWSYGYAAGMTTAAMASAWATPYYYSAAYHGYPCCASTSASVYGNYGNVKYGGSSEWYANSSSYGVKGSGTFSNQATGTTGTYNTNRSYDYDTNTQSAKVSGSYETQGGRSGDYSRKASCDYDTGRYTASGSTSVDTKSGGELEHSTSYATGGGQPTSVDRSTSYTTSGGQSYSTGTGDRGNDVYAGADGHAYQRGQSGGWQQAGASGWQNAAGNHSWADREEQGRGQAQERFGSFNRGGFGGGGGFGGRGGGFGGGRGGGRR